MKWKAVCLYETNPSSRHFVIQTNASALSESGEKYAQIKRGLEVKTVFETFLNKYVDVNFENTRFCTSQDINCGLDSCGLLWCFHQLFQTHFDGTHSMQIIHWWASDAMLNFTKSVLMKKNSISRMACVWKHFQQIFIFGWISPLGQG